MNSPARVLRRPRSMIARLAGLQILTVAVLMSGTLVTVYAMMATLLEEDNRDFLHNQTVVLSSWLTDSATHVSGHDREFDARLLRLLSTLPEIQARLQSPDGTILLESHDPEPPPADAFPAPGVEPTEWRSPDHVRHLLNSLWLPAGPDQRRLLLQVAYGTDDDDTLLRHLRQRMAYVFGFALLLSGALALLIARGIFRPLAELTAATAQVQASRLSARLHKTDWPTELATLAREFDAMLARLDDSFGRLASFSADLSHELRTPINNLRGEAEVALNRSRTPEEYREALESILVECGRLGRLIDDLLFIAKSDFPEDCLRRSELDATAACHAVAEFFEPLVTERNLTLWVRGRANVNADPDLLRRALINLIDNSIRHVATGGQIELIIRELPDRVVEIEVRDNGAGIPAEQLPRVFERFYRNASNRGGQQAGNGLGLGLAIVKSIMKLHHGTVKIVSSLGFGTGVILRFPAR